MPEFLVRFMPNADLTIKVEADDSPHTPSAARMRT